MNKKNTFFNRLTRYLNPRVGLANELDVHAAASGIRKNIPFRGPNVFILAFAIIIASVGLNVNSIPVIIGAMLISPLMGPIVGIGLALGTNDMKLFRHALKNLVIMVGISIAASSIYFVLTPLKLENPTELLARTNPTIYDVLIAFFGGLAGIFETSRKERGTVISGVAIATALMPPLCTIGFGISQLNVHYALGALYLFFINSTFIALAAFIGVKYLGFENAVYHNEAQRRRITRSIWIIITIIIIPSLFSAISIIRQNNFERHVAAFVKSTHIVGNDLVYDFRINHETKPSTVELFLTDEELGSANRETLYQLAEEHHIRRTQVAFNTSSLGGQRNSKFMADLYQRSEDIIRAKDSTIRQLQQQLDELQNTAVDYPQIAAEIRSQYPSVTEVTLADGKSISTKESNNSITSFIVLLKTNTPLPSEDINKLQRWLEVRLSKSVTVLMAP